METRTSRRGFSCILASMCMADLLFAQDDSGVDVESAPESRSEAVSLFQTFAANWGGLQNFDVEIEHESFRVEGGNRSEESKYKMRLVADFVKNRYLFAGTGQKERSAPKAQNRFRGRTVGGFYMDMESGEAWRRSTASKPAQKIMIGIGEDRDVRKALAHSGYPDVRLVGSMAFPRVFLPHVDIGGHFVREFSGANMTARTLDDGVIDVVEKIPVGKKSLFVRRYEFDAELLVPRRMTFIRSNREESNGRTEQQQLIEWKDFNGTVLPTEIIGEQMVTLSRAIGDRVPEQHDIQFRWSVVNDEKKLPPIEASTIGDTQTLLNFVAE